jgi:hypothetical protein
MPYMAQDMQPQLQAGLSDLPLLMILAGVLLCAGIAATTLALIRRTRRGPDSATARLSPAAVALKIAVALAVLLAAAAFFVTDSGGITEAIARIKGEPCCVDDQGQPCCPEMQGGDRAPEKNNTTAADGDDPVAGQTGEDAIQ